jgi:glycosyltransferase involved in cell wall biosynthesis
MTRVAAAIPALDAAATIETVVRAARRQLAEVLVVDDGSRDATAARARAAGARVVAHGRNRGKGAALRTAFAELFAAGHDAVVTLDADGQHLADEIPKLLDGLARGGDLVLGSRAHLFGGMRLHRRLANRFSSRAISFAAGQRVPDVQTGFRAYRRALVERIGFRENGFEAESAAVVRAARLGFRIVVVPVALGAVDGACNSHYRAFVDSARIAYAVTRARCEFLA